jgi:surface antigen Omp85-like protein
MTVLPTLSLLAAAACLAAGPVSAQSPEPGLEHDTLAAPGAHYRASGLHRFLLGKEYRSLWATPISVAVLDLRTFAGGLRPVSKGGGQQTKSLRLVAPDGREFFFRSVDKDPSATLQPELRGTLAGSVVRDQTSSAFPTAPLVVAKLLTATGILHGRSWLAVLPREGLGEFENAFAGLMGFLEERVSGPSGPPAHWGGATEIIGTDSLVARTSRSADDRVDARAFLKARLFDLLIGDWDRHSDQWVWARFGETRPRRWVPVPRDRDQAMAKYDGLLLGIARQNIPKLTNFGPKYPYIAGATWNGRELDRRYLSELDWPVWESVVGTLQAELTDRAIDDAVHALPPEHYAIAGAELASALRTRRDHLPEAAGKYYRMLGQQSDVYATAASDQARLVRDAQGNVEVSLSRDSVEEPYFRRQFDRSVTKEVRLYLGQGDDTALVSGSRSGGPLLRVVAGEGNDQLVDSTGSGGERFYDDPQGPARTAVSNSGVDRRPYVAPRKSPADTVPRDWGSRWTASTQVSYAPDVGLFVGGGRTLTRYGFRKNPYASRHRFRAGWAFGPMSYRVDYRGEFRREHSGTYAVLLARASGIDVLTFHGFGNEIAAPGDKEFYRVTQDAYAIYPGVTFPLASATVLQVAPFLKYASTDNRPDRFLATQGNLYGTGNFGELGGGIRLVHDSRDRVNAASRGSMLEVWGNIYPAVWDVDSTFGEVHGEARTFLTAKMPLRPTLALRAGGRKVWGHYPFLEAAYIGGSSTVRLGRENRYAGDASAYSSAELRIPVARVTLVLPADFGVFGLADVGRVFLRGESSDKWHGAIGGGVSLAYLEPSNTISVALAKSEERTGVYIQAGFGF